MVFLLGARSLHHALRSLSKKAQKRLVSQIFTILGRSCNPNAVNNRKTSQYFFKHCFKSKRDLILWHDEVINILSEHPSNGKTPLTAQQSQNVLTIFRDWTKAVVYCKRQGVPDLFENLKSTVFTVHILKDLFSERKARNKKLFKQYSLLHQLHELEWMSLTLILEYSEKLPALVQKSRPKKLNKRRRRATRNRLLVTE